MPASVVHRPRVAAADASSADERGSGGGGYSSRCDDGSGMIALSLPVNSGAPRLFPSHSHSGAVDTDEARSRAERVQASRLAERLARRKALASLAAEKDAEEAKASSRSALDVWADPSIRKPAGGMKPPMLFSLCMAVLLLLVGAGAFIRNEFVDARAAQARSRAQNAWLDTLQQQQQHELQVFATVLSPMPRLPHLQSAPASLFGEQAYPAPTVWQPHELLRFDVEPGDNSTTPTSSSSGCKPEQSMPSTFITSSKGYLILPILGIIFFLAALGILQTVYLDTLARWMAAERGWSTREGESMAINLLAIIPQLWFQVFALQWTTRDVGFGTVLGATASNMFGITTILAKVLPGTLPLATTTATAIAAAVAASLEGEEDAAAAAAAAAFAATTTDAVVPLGTGLEHMHPSMSPDDKIIVASLRAGDGVFKAIGASEAAEGGAGAEKALVPDGALASPVAAAGVVDGAAPAGAAAPAAGAVAAAANPAAEADFSRGSMLMHAFTRMSKTMSDMRTGLSGAVNAVAAGVGVGVTAEEKARQAALKKEKAAEKERHRKKAHAVGFTVFWYRAARDSFAFCVAILLLVSTTISSNKIGPVNTIPLLLGMVLYAALWIKSPQIYQWTAKGVKHATVCLNSTDPELNPNQKLIAFLEGNLFAVFINLLIMGSVVSVIWDEFDGPSWLTSVNFCFSAIFILECVVKHFAYGIFGYWKEPLCAFDGVLVVLILFELIFSGGSIAGSVRVVRLFRFLRTLRGMRAMRVIRGLTWQDGRLVYVKPVVKRKAKGAALAVIAAHRAASAAAHAAANEHALAKEEEAKRAEGGEGLLGSAGGQEDEHSGNMMMMEAGLGLQTNRKFSAIGDRSLQDFANAEGMPGAIDAPGAEGPATAPAPPRRRTSLDAQGVPLSIGVAASVEGSAATERPPHTQQLADRAPPPARAGGPLLSPVAATPADQEQIASPSNSAAPGAFTLPSPSQHAIAEDKPTDAPSALVTQRPQALLLHSESFQNADDDAVTALASGAAGPASARGVGPSPNSFSSATTTTVGGGLNPLATPKSLFKPVVPSSASAATGGTMASASSGDEALGSPRRPLPAHAFASPGTGTGAAALHSPLSSGGDGFSSGADLDSPSAAAFPGNRRHIVLRSPSVLLQKRALKAALPRATFKRAKQVVAEEESAAATLQRNEQWLQQQHDLSHAVAAPGAPPGAGAAASTLPPGSRLLLQNRLHHHHAASAAAASQSDANDDDQKASPNKAKKLSAPSAAAASIEMQHLARSLFPETPKGRQAAAALRALEEKQQAPGGASESKEDSPFAPGSDGGADVLSPVHMVDASTEVYVNMVEGTLSPVVPLVEHTPVVPMKRLKPAASSSAASAASGGASGASGGASDADVEMSPESSPREIMAPPQQQQASPPAVVRVHSGGIAAVAAAAGVLAPAHSPTPTSQLPGSAAPTPPPHPGSALALPRPEAFVAARPSGIGAAGLGLPSSSDAPSSASRPPPPRGLAPAPIGGPQSSAYYMQALGLVKTPAAVAESTAPDTKELKLREARVVRASTTFVPSSAGALSTSGSPSGAATPNGGLAAGGSGQKAHVRRVSTSIQLGGHNQPGGARVADSSFLRQMSLLPVVSASHAGADHVGAEHSDSELEPHQHRRASLGGGVLGAPEEEPSVLGRGPKNATATEDAPPPRHMRRRSSIRRQSLGGVPVAGRRASAQGTGALFTVRGADGNPSADTAGGEAGDQQPPQHQPTGLSRQRTSRRTDKGDESGGEHSSGAGLGVSRQHSMSVSSRGGDSDNGSSRGGSEYDDDEDRGSDFDDEDEDTEYNSELGASSDYPSTEFDSDDSDASQGGPARTRTRSGSRKRRKVRAWTVLPKHLFWLRRPVAIVCLSIMCAIVIASFALGVMDQINPSDNA